MTPYIYKKLQYASVVPVQFSPKLVVLRLPSCSSLHNISYLQMDAHEPPIGPKSVKSLINPDDPGIPGPLIDSIYQ